MKSADETRKENDRKIRKKGRHGDKERKRDGNENGRSGKEKENGMEW